VEETAPAEPQRERGASSTSSSEPIDLEQDPPVPAEVPAGHDTPVGALGEGEEALSPYDFQYYLANQQRVQLKFFVFQTETCPTTGRKHFQLYIQTMNPTALSTMHELLDFFKFHIEPAQGSPTQNVKYCTKEESRAAGPWKWGEEPHQGSRSDISTIKELIKSGHGMRRIAEEATSYQALKSAELLLKYIEQPRPIQDIDVRWYHGATATGKTRSAMEEFPEAWKSSGSLRWWDGYDAHKAVVIDDFRPSFCSFPYLLEILDRYPVRIENKGGSRQLQATTIIVTCPYTPQKLFHKRLDEDVNQLVRRIATIKLFGDHELDAPVYESDVGKSHKD